MKKLIRRNKKLKVFLGGTCNESMWREILKPQLNIDYFDPIVDDWTPECQEEEIRQRQLCDFLLYVITPKMKGVYSIAEAVDDANKFPEKTIFCYMPEDDGVQFSDSQKKSLAAVAKLVQANGGCMLDGLNSIAKFLNNQISKG